MTISLTFAILLSVAMIVVAAFTWLYHDTKHRDLESWVQYGFSVETLRHAILYYRSMAVSMLVFFVLFTVSCLMLQSEGYRLFAYPDGRPAATSPIGTAMFALDLVLRGGFFDVMEHFEITASTVLMNRDNGWFVLYCFVFRIYYALTLMRILVSFVWIWMRIRRARRASGELAGNEGFRRRGLRLRVRRPGRSRSETGSTIP